MNPEHDDSLIGGDFAAVCARFGAPRGCLHEDGALLLAYETATGEVVIDAVQLVDGVVAAARADIRRSAMSCCGQELVGLPIERALPALGTPRSIEAIGDSTRLLFADREVTVHEGTVACVLPLSPFTRTA